MTASDYAAWYAALVATAVAVWDVVKYKKSGPSIAGQAKVGWQSVGLMATEGMSLSIASLSNRGDRATTIISWGMYWYPQGTSLRNKEERKGFIVNPGLGGSGKIPQKIQPGDTWQGLMQETPDIDEMMKNGRLFFAFKFSHAEDEMLLELKKE